MINKTGVQKMNNKKLDKTLFIFHIDDERFFLRSKTKAAAMAKMNRDVVDKRNLHPMVWFSHKDDNEIPENTYVLLRKEWA
tara:strand:+ start:2153 stop:2395 length:243 start_codon:yes stop_codon:yes gene_type:complete